MSNQYIYKVFFDFLGCGDDDSLRKVPAIIANNQKEWQDYLKHSSALRTERQDYLKHSSASRTKIQSPCPDVNSKWADVKASRDDIVEQLKRWEIPESVLDRSVFNIDALPCIHAVYLRLIQASGNGDHTRLEIVIDHPLSQIEQAAILAEKRWQFCISQGDLTWDEIVS